MFLTIMILRLGILYYRYWYWYWDLAFFLIDTDTDIDTSKYHDTEMISRVSSVPVVVSFIGYICSIATGIMSARLWPFWLKWFPTGWSFFPVQSLIFDYFLRSKDKTFKNSILHASPWALEPYSSGMDFHTLQDFFANWSKGGTRVKKMIKSLGCPCDSKVQKFM